MPSLNLLHRTLGLVPRKWLKSAARLQWRHPLLKQAFEVVASGLRQTDGVIAQGIGKGLRFNPGRSNPGYLLGTTEPGLQFVYRELLKPGMVVYDLGASVGFQAMLAGRLVGPTGKVFCFEPLRENVERLEDNARKNGFAHVRAFDVALSDAEGEASFVVSQSPNWGRLSQFGSPAGASTERRVQVRRLDEFRKTRALPFPSFIKMDVEGAEANVLAGAQETLRGGRPILFFDVHGTNATMAEALNGLDYRMQVLGGGGRPLEDAGWDAQVLAIPGERRELEAFFMRCADASVCQ